MQFHCGSQKVAVSLRHFNCGSQKVAVSLRHLNCGSQKVAVTLGHFNCGSQKVAVSLRHFNPSYYFPLNFPIILCLGHHLRSDLESNLPNYTPGSPVLRRWVNRLLKKLNQSFSLFDQLTKLKILLLIQSG
jgi:hypothetical protein